MRRVALLALLALLPAVLAGCGGSLASAPAGDDAADLLPSSVDLVVSLDGELEGERWAQAEELLDRFPLLRAFAGEALGGLGGTQAEWDAALGPEVVLAVVNLEYREAVGLTRPDDPEELRRLVGEAGGAVAELDGGWWAAARDERAIERLLTARAADGALSGRGDFRRLGKELPDDALATIFVRGGSADDALADLRALPEPLGRALDCLAAGREIPSAAFALRAEPGGVRVDGALDRPEGWPDGGDGFWNIADTVPERPLLFAGASSLPEGLDRALACAAGADGEATQLLRLLGAGATSLLTGEVAVAVHPAPRRSDRPNPPTVTLWAEIEDEQAARASIEELAGLASALVPGLTVEDVDVHPDQTRQAKVVERDGEPILYLGLDPGLLVVSNTERGVEGLLTIHDAPLSADRRYRAALEETFGGYPSEEDALLYLDADAARDQARALGTGGTWAGELEPLDTLLLAARDSGDTVIVRGFLAID